MEIESSVNCPHCDNEQFIAVHVPDSAWETNGAYWSFNDVCDECEEELKLEGRVISEIELC